MFIAKNITREVRIPIKKKYSKEFFSSVDVNPCIPKADAAPRIRTNTAKEAVIFVLSRCSNNDFLLLLFSLIFSIMEKKSKLKISCKKFGKKKDFWKKRKVFYPLSC